MRNKYKAVKKVVNGIKFDSKAESIRYNQLRILEKAGEITDLSLQPQFELQVTFKCKGKTERGIKYIADFQYIEKSTGLCVVEDVKGIETKEFKIKRKLFLYKYGEQYDLRIVKISASEYRYWG